MTENNDEINNKKPPQIKSQFQFKLKTISKIDQNQQKFPIFTIIPATEKAKVYILKLKKQNEDLQDIIIQLENKIQTLEKRLSNYEAID